MRNRTLKSFGCCWMAPGRRYVGAACGRAFPRTFTLGRPGGILAAPLPLCGERAEILCGAFRSAPWGAPVTTSRRRYTRTAFGNNVCRQYAIHWIKLTSARRWESLAHKSRKCRVFHVGIIRVSWAGSFLVRRIVSKCNWIYQTKPSLPHLRYIEIFL